MFIHGPRVSARLSPTKSKNRVCRPPKFCSHFAMPRNDSPAHFVPRIVADGPSGLRRCPEFRTRLRELRESIHARYAAELAGAGFFQRLILRWRMAAEFRTARGRIEPSPGSLYSSQIIHRLHRTRLTRFGCKPGVSWGRYDSGYRNGMVSAIGQGNFNQSLALLAASNFSISAERSPQKAAMTRQGRNSMWLQPFRTLSQSRCRV